MLHHTEDMETVKSSLDDALKKAIKEIKDRMESIKVDIRRIRNAREGEKESRRRVRREVVTYYEGFADQVNRHRSDLESKISTHHDNCNNLLFSEEVTLEQYHSDLRQLCFQIERILNLKDCVEMVKLMAPVARRLENISEKIMTTGETILHQLQFVPKRLSLDDIPGFLSTFTVNPGKSYAQIEKPIYEKVLCTIPLYLADDNGLQLDVFHDINIDSEMLMNSANNHVDKDIDNVYVSVENHSQYGWRLRFCPPFAGAASLSVKVDGKHLRNSPYVINVRNLSLEDDEGANVKTSDNSNENAFKSGKKSVKFNTQFYEM